MAALCLKVCHLTDKDITLLVVLEKKYKKVKVKATL
jgi:hypothetical protein